MVEQRYENGRFVWRQFYAELKATAVLDYDTKAKAILNRATAFHQRHCYREHQL
jgi:hypothetical protein